MGSIKKVDKICQMVRMLTDEDIAAVENMQQEQSGYTHPLKVYLQSVHNANGEYNKRVISHLKDLRKVILAN
jgi:hypothetical protein